MFTIIFSWIILFSIIFLIGKLFFNSKTLKFLKVKEEMEWYQYFWIGFVVVLGILQIWSLFLPVNVYSLIFMGLLAVTSAILLTRKKIKLPKVNLLFVLLTVSILITLSYFASLSGGWPDTLGYHITAVKWANLSRVVPGLANLYTRLGFNSSSFLYEAMVGNLYLKDRAGHVAISLLTSVLSIEYLWIFLTHKNNHLKTFILLSLPIFIEGIVKSVQISSFSYDFVLLILILAICVELTKWTKTSIYISAMLSFLLITIKLSGAVFSIIVIGFAIYGLFWRKRNEIQGFIFLFFLGIGIIIPYIVRNIILTGWALYPLPVLKLNLPWTVPADRVIHLFTVIRGWAIAGGAWRSVVNQNFLQWFPGWYSRNSGHIEIKIFVLSLILLIGYALIIKLNKWKSKINLGIIACVAASFISVFYLMFSAPDFRFGGVYFWTFFASTGSLIMTVLFRNKPKIINFVAAISILLTLYISLPVRADSKIILRSLRWDQPGDTYQIIVAPADGSPSFKLNMAKEDSSCGSTNLPCTSEVSNDFKEIIPGNIFGGFAPIK